MKKTFFVEYKLHFEHGENAEGDMTVWWDGTGEGLFALKEEIKNFREFGGRRVEYVEIRAMLECFGDPVK